MVPRIIVRRYKDEFVWFYDHITHSYLRGAINLIITDISLVVGGGRNVFHCVHCRTQCENEFIYIHVGAVKARH